MMDRSKYPENWEEISRRIRFDVAGAQCQCEGECGLHKTHPGPRRCLERNGEPVKWARGIIVLTVSHLNHNTWDNRDENLKAMCQRCHLRYDQPLHQVHAAETRRDKRRAAGQTDLGFE